MQDFKDKCPYCDGDAFCETVDIGVGYQQVGPYICYGCESYQIHSNDMESKKQDNTYFYTDEERKIGWAKSPYLEEFLMDKILNIFHDIMEIEKRKYENSRLTHVE